MAADIPQKALQFFTIVKMAADVSQIVTNPRVPYLVLEPELQKNLKAAADVSQYFTFLRAQALDPLNCKKN